MQALEPCAKERTKEDEIQFLVEANLTPRQEISLWPNGEEIRVIHPGIGHTDGDLVIWFTKSNAVHMGDEYFAGAFPFVDEANGGSVRGLIQSLDVIIRQIPADAKIIPGHGPVTDVDELRKYRDMLVGTVAAVKKELDAEKTVEQMQGGENPCGLGGLGKGLYQAGFVHRRDRERSGEK